MISAAYEYHINRISWYSRKKKNFLRTFFKISNKHTHIQVMNNSRTFNRRKYKDSKRIDFPQMLASFSEKLCQLRMKTEPNRVIYKVLKISSYWISLNIPFLEV